MKKGTVKYSKEFKTAIGTSVWLGIENEYDMINEGALDAFKSAKDSVDQFAKETGLVLFAQIENIPPAPPTELPVINKAEERLGILIENATTKEELMGYKNDITTPRLSEMFSSKLVQLNIKSRDNATY